MSKIFFPYIYHGSIAHIYYLILQYHTHNDPLPKKFKAGFSTGIRELYESEYELAYIHLLDQMLLYDECYIPVDDVMYLIGVLGFETTMKLVKSKGVKLYDALSNRIGLLFGPMNEWMMFNDKSPETTDTLDLRIDKLYEPLRFKFDLDPKWKPELISLFKDAFFINDITGLFSDTEVQTLKELKNSEVQRVLDLSTFVTSKNQNEQQYKANRLLHYHYYRRISSLLECDYIYVPVELEGLYDYYSHLNKSKKDKLGVIFDKITKLERIPDIPSLIQSGTLSVDDILQIRETDAAKRFRKWIDALNISQTGNINLDEYTKLYHEACMTNNKFKKAYNGKAGSAVRTLGLVAIGAASSGVGLGLTFVDYLISVGLDDYNPASYTREKLKTLINKKSK